jgi:hypothetical protein
MCQPGGVCTHVSALVNAVDLVTGVGAVVRCHRSAVKSHPHGLLGGGVVVVDVELVAVSVSIELTRYGGRESTRNLERGALLGRDLPLDDPVVLAAPDFEAGDVAGGDVRQDVDTLAGVFGFFESIREPLELLEGVDIVEDQPPVVGVAQVAVDPDHSESRAWADAVVPSFEGSLADVLTNQIGPLLGCQLEQPLDRETVVFELIVRPTKIECLSLPSVRNRRDLHVQRMRLVVAENWKNWDVEGVFEERVELGDCLCVVVNSGLPHSMTYDVTGVVHVVEVLKQYHYQVDTLLVLTHVSLALSDGLFDQVPWRVCKSVVRPVPTSCFG